MLIKLGSHRCRSWRRGRFSVTWYGWSTWMLGFEIGVQHGFFDFELLVGPLELAFT